jgi:hypothetical protein
MARFPARPALCSWVCSDMVVSFVTVLGSADDGR